MTQKPKFLVIPLRNESGPFIIHSIPPFLQMLKYISPDGADDDGTSSLSSRGPYGLIVSGVVFGETSVGHSGTYKCEPGAAPAAKVLVHVIDGERGKV